MTKRRDGNGLGGEPATLTLLESIRDELVSLRGDVVSLREEVRGGFAELRGDVQKLSGRIDNVLLGELGDSVRRHDREIAELRDELRQRRRQ